MPGVQEMQRELELIRLLAIDALLGAIAGADMSDRRSAIATLEEAFSAIVRAFGEQAAEAAVRYLEIDREAAGAHQNLAIVPSFTIPDEQLRATLEWAVRPLDNGLIEQVESQLSGATQRYVSKGARDTISDNIQRAGTRFARVPRADACAFCLMLGSRGAVYLTQFTATRTTGRSTAASGRPAGLDYHDNCRCDPIEIRDDNEDELPEITGQLEQLWADSGARSLQEFTTYLRDNPFAEGVRY